MVGFCNQLRELHKIRRERHTLIVVPKTLVGISQRHLPQNVKFAPPTAGKLDFGFEEKVELAREAALRLTGTLRHGLDESVRNSKPGDNQARFGQLGFAQEHGAGRFHAEE
jgi:hypothetical protein